VRVLVTGAGGQLARALLATAPAGIETIACSRAELDIGDQRAVTAALRKHAPDTVINTAAYTAVDRAESEPQLAARANSDGPYFLAHACRSARTRLLHVSTDFVFDGRTSLPYRPEAACRPLNVYGQSKRAGERRVLRALPERSVIVRTSWVYGAVGKNFLHTMLRLMRERGAVRVVTDQVGTPTATRPLAQTLWRIAATDTLSGLHHWTDAGVASWYDFASAIAEEAQQLQLLPRPVTVEPIPSSAYPTPAQRPAFSVLDKSSLTAYGWVPQHWRVRLREVLKEIKDG
jgi:dTDP-4-dehydrorhamnose reductase